MVANGMPEVIEQGPPWWKIGVGGLAGVVGGAVLFLVLQLPITFLIDQLIGRSVWQRSIAGFSEPVRLGLLLLYWTIPLALGQWLSALISGWSKATYFATAIQIVHMVSVFRDLEFAPLWFQPLMIALAFAKANWAEAAAAKGRASRESIGS
jgi:hypothetical protein